MPMLDYLVFLGEIQTDIDFNSNNIARNNAPLDEGPKLRSQEVDVKHSLIGLHRLLARGLLMSFVCSIWTIQ